MVQAGHMYAQHAQRAAHTCGRLVPSLQGHIYMGCYWNMMGIISKTEISGSLALYHRYMDIIVFNKIPEVKAKSQQQASLH